MYSLPPSPLQGSDDSQRLHSAASLLQRQQRDLETLRGRNRALTQDLLRQPAAAGSGSGAGGAGAGAGGAAGVTGALSSSSAADVEARVAAELRANRAEMEAGALRQQLQVRCGEVWMCPLVCMCTAHQSWVFFGA